MASVTSVDRLVLLNSGTIQEVLIWDFSVLRLCDALESLNSPQSSIWLRQSDNWVKRPDLLCASSAFSASLRFKNVRAPIFTAETQRTQRKRREFLGRHREHRGSTEEFQIRSLPEITGKQHEPVNTRASYM